MELQDGWRGKRAPEGGRYGPVGADLWSAQLRRGWEDEIRATEVAQGAEGRAVYADREDVDLLGWAVVWVSRQEAAR